MGLGPNAYGTVWFDDVQLERSDNASTFNLVENSAFTNGQKNWDTWSSESASVTWAGLSGFANCSKLTGSVENQYNRQRQYLNVSGKKGDVFAYGAWAYANSAPLNNTKDSDDYKPYFALGIDYYDKNGKWIGCINKYFNPDVREAWQFLADEIVMPSDYGNIAITFTYDHNVNKSYHTGSFCYKEQYGQTYTYDKDGNVVSSVDLAKTNSTFAYYGNQMAKMLNPSGSKYLYSYNDKKQLTASLSSDGLEYGFSYDDKGNVTKADITSRKPVTSLENGKEYIIVNAYSANAINAGITGKESEALNTTPYERSADKQQWKAEAVSGQSNVFYFKAVKHSNRYLDVRAASSTSGANIQIYRGNGTDAQKFKLVKQSDGSFGIFTGASNYNLCLDAQFDSSEIIKQRALKQSSCDKNNLKESQKWYVYPVESNEDRIISTQTEYTQSKNFVSKSIDERGNATSYSYDENKGTLQSVTNANNVTTEYTYDPNNNSLLSVSSSGLTNSYSYSKDRLQYINVNGGLQYKFAYDKFGRTTGNYVGNGTDWHTLSTIQYNNSGLMSKQTYGNGDYVEFSYDNLDRQTQKRYNGNNSQRVTYSYGNNGSVAQSTDYYTNTNTRFVYDLADRVVSQREFTGTDTSGGTLRSYTDFTYADKTNYLTGVKHYSPLGTQKIGYRYGDLSKGEMPDQIYSVTWNGNQKVSYVYDGLGRLTTRNIASFDTRYTYENVGDNKTTTLVKSVETPAGTYTYTYDNIGNILSTTDGTNTTSYEYDSLNQLVRVNDERAGKTYTYSYSNGNITEKKEY
uniref:RICIN domain-containing protein n=1 Tax=Eubacterium sp. TaxID=142586 RepID=UPI00402865B1